MRKYIEAYDEKFYYDDTPEKHKEVFDRVIEYFKKYKMIFGEAIMQDDDAQIYAPEVLSDIADDIIKFDENE